MRIALLSSMVSRDRRRWLLAPSFLIVTAALGCGETDETPHNQPPPGGWSGDPPARAAPRLVASPATALQAFLVLLVATAARIRSRSLPAQKRCQSMAALAGGTSSHFTHRCAATRAMAVPKPKQCATGPRPMTPPPAPRRVKVAPPTLVERGLQARPATAPAQWTLVAPAAQIR